MINSLNCTSSKEHYPTINGARPLQRVEAIIQQFASAPIYHLKSDASSSQKYLDPSQRPQDLKTRIEGAYNSLVGDTDSRWGLYNGTPEYCICQIDEHAAIKKMIQGAPPTQKEFFVLDIGAGNFQWNNELARFLNAQSDLPKDIIVNAIGVRGESYKGKKYEQKGRCKIYKFGAFKIEEISKEFAKHNLELENKIDLTISRWCFRHLADPVGTFVQTYNLLKPKTGTLLIDGFIFADERGSAKKAFDPNDNMIQLFLDTKAPFLMNPYDSGRSLNHFMLRRPDERPCQLPMSYLGLETIPGGWQVGSYTVTHFNRDPQQRDSELFLSGPPTKNGAQYTLYGDKTLYEWLKQNHLIYIPYITWMPLHKSNIQQMLPPLHRALLENEQETVEQHLRTPSSINESDALGRTALHIAIEKKDLQMIRQLLKKNPDLKLSNGNGDTPLNEAIRRDPEGSIIREIIRAGAKVNTKMIPFVCDETPLDIAISKLNIAAIQILIKSGAEISKKNHKHLQMLQWPLNVPSQGAFSKL